MTNSRKTEVRAKHSRYIVTSLLHAAEVMGAFHSGGEVLRLRDVVARTTLSKGTCFRILYTLHVCNFVEKLGTNQYRLVRDVRPARKFRIGYAAQGQDSSLSREVNASLVRAAETANVELVVVDNRYDARVAVRNADHLIREEVELVIEFQTDEAVAPVIARKLLDAGIPVIAIDIPHPGATYFGANNYEAGQIAGRHLARYAAQHWDGQVDEILTLEIRRAGSVPQTRIHGVLAGITGILNNPNARIVQLDGDGQFGVSLEAVRKHLRGSQSKRVLVGAANDPSALGALRAFQEAGRMEQCAIVGQNAEPQGRAELRKSNTSLIGSVAYFPEKYGPRVIRLALDILEHKPTPPALFMKHQLVTAENVNHFYPNDSLIERLQQHA
jgi:ribose transport system substrate-binding protein